MSVEKLKEKVWEAVENRGLRNMHVTWGPEAGELTPDERADHILELMKETDRWDALPTEEQMRIQIRQSYQYLSDVIDLCKSHASEISEDSLRRAKIHGGIEQAMLFLGNWIDQETKTVIRKSRGEK